MPRYRNLERPWVISALLALAVFAAYLPAYYLGFINFDDTFYVTHNHFVQQGLTLDGMRWAFTQFYAANWHPLTWLSHMLDCQLYGLNPLGHHLTNVLFHAANTVILFLWLRSLTGAVWRSVLVAALFALHPLRVESVAWVAERKDVLAAFFGLLTLWAYGKYARARANPGSNLDATPKKAGKSAVKAQAKRPGGTPGRPVLFYLLALVLFALGLLSKPMLVTWPFVLLVLDYWPLGRMTDAPGAGPESAAADGKRILVLVVEKIPFFVLSAGSCVVTFLAQRAGGAVSSLQGTYAVSVASRIGNMPISYVRYLGKLVWPHDLAIVYPLDREWPEEQMAGAAVLLMVVSGVALWRARRNPYFPVGWFWYLGTMVPVIGLVQVGTQSIADRYTYIPTIGLLIVLVWGIADFAGRWKGNGTVLLSASAAGLLALLAWLDGRQLLYWQNSDTLFRHALAVTRNNYVAQLQLGMYFTELGDLEPAKARYRATLEIAPELPTAWNNLGCALVTQKRYEEAAEAFRKVLQVKPQMAEAQSNLGNALFCLGRTDEALEHYRDAVRIEPGNALAQYNLGNVLSQKNEFNEGIEHLRLAVKLDPQYPDAYTMIASTLVRQGKLDDAAAEYRRAVAFTPAPLPARFGYAALLASQNKWEEAAAQYSAILQQAPKDNQARLNLGIAEAALGKSQEAIEIFSTVLQANPDDASANYHIAAVLADDHRFRDAIPYYRAAVKNSPDFSEAMNNLAWILASNPDPALRNGPEAVTLAEKACELTGYKEALIVGTLAAAYAEAGRFPDAVKAGEKAKALADAASDKALSARNAELLELYRSGKPYRDTR